MNRPRSSTLLKPRESKRRRHGRKACWFVLALFLLGWFAIIVLQVVHLEEVGSILIGHLNQFHLYDSDEDEGFHCSWIVMAGDSNTRNLVEQLVPRLMKDTNTTEFVQMKRYYINTTEEVRCKPGTNYILPRDARDPNQVKDFEGDTRWADREYVFYKETSGECLILTNRFISDQSPSHERMAKNISHAARWTSELEQPDNNRTKRPTHPDFIWFSHGLWGLPPNNVSTLPIDGEYCQERFSNTTKMIRSLSRHRATKLVWVTNFPINSHYSINNEYLKWDMACQKRHANQCKIELFDIPKLLLNNSGDFDSISADFKKLVNTYHLSSAAYSNVIDIVDERYLQPVWPTTTIGATKRGPAKGSLHRNQNG